MPGGDERFRRYQDVGADFLEEARRRAEEFLNDFSKVGDSTHRQAHGAVDDMVGGSRRNTGLIVNAVRDEMAAQLSLLGIATKRDLEDLERRLVARFSTPPATPPTARKAGPAKKQGTARKAAPAKTAGARKRGAAGSGPPPAAGSEPTATGEA
jgi:polyhydroxyalkanoate synthesis regulator phasin